uniref:Uncharacterized protein n=1 Tax=Heterorhabditis bacteriophora TaxID=37862 RepID=A0A1I7XFA6_HETBA
MNYNRHVVLNHTTQTLLEDNKTVGCCAQIDCRSDLVDGRSESLASTIEEKACDFLRGFE